VEPSSAPWRVIESTEPEPVAHERGPGSRGLPWPAIGAALVAVVVAVAALLVTARPEPVIGIDGAVVMNAGSDAHGGTRTAGPASTAGEVPAGVVVDVGGAVLRPGVYHLPAGSRVADAIEAAGGYGASVDADRVAGEINLAAVVLDGAKIRVPVRGEAAPAAPVAAGGSGAAGGSDAAGGSGGAGATGGSDAGGSGDAGGLVDLNSASAEALDGLPGVGPKTAAKIIAAREERPFAAVDDLLARKVVGPATLEKLRPLVRVGP
jgi:competence protein ComEA